MAVTIDDLRRFAIARMLPQPTTLGAALRRFGFVQADPIRAPARAQDLVLRHRVAGYRAGDLERRYTTLGIEEDVFINYGFVTQSLQMLMHPRRVEAGWTRARRRRAEELLAFVQEHGEVHPREVNDHFAHGTVTNYWGGSSSATTHLLDGMHYAGLLRVARREAGIRIYAAREASPGPVDPDARRARVDALVDILVSVYAPLPARSLSDLVSRLRYAAPQWQRDFKRRWRAHGAGWHTRASTASIGSGRHRTLRRTRPTARLACWRRSIRSCGTAGASSTCGRGPTASRPIRPCASATRLLRAATALGRPHRRLGKPVRRGGQAAGALRLHRRSATRGQRVRAGAGRRTVASARVSRYRGLSGHSRCFWCGAGTLVPAVADTTPETEVPAPHGPRRRWWAGTLNAGGSQPHSYSTRVSLLQRVQVRGDVPGVLLAHPHLRHGRFPA